MLPDNLGYLFDVATNLTPQAPAVLAGDAVFSFEALDARCNRMANALGELGVGAGDRVGLMFTNDFRFLESLFGTMRLGAVAVPLNIRMGDEALAHVLRDAEVKVVIANQGMAERACRLMASFPEVRLLLEGGAASGRALDYETVVSAAAPSFPRRRNLPGDVCMQPYTSGSTGKPKGVLLTHAGQIWNADLMRAALEIDDTDRALVAVPLFHKNAMAGAVKPFLLAGGSLVILPAFDAVEVIRAIDRDKVTYLTGVPAMYKMMLAEAEALAEHDVTSLRYALCGSAEVSDELLTEFARVFGAPIAESYGLTEGGPVPLMNTRSGLKKRGSCGREIPDCEVKLVGPDGVTDVGIETVGELITRNPGLATGYWKLPAVTAERFKDGWLRTGDLFRRDADGYYYFVGRKDDMINVAGENVYPKEIEDILLRHPNLADACVVPAPHEVKGEVPVAFVRERQRSGTSEDEIKRFFMERGAPYAHPRRVFFVEAMPLTGAGKIDRTALKKIAAAPDQPHGETR